MVSFVDSKREDGAAMGTGEVTGRAAASERPDSKARREHILERELSFVVDEALDGLGVVPVLLRNFLLTLIALNFLAVGAIVPVRGGVDVLEDGDGGRSDMCVRAGDEAAADASKDCDTSVEAVVGSDGFVSCVSSGSPAPGPSPEVSCAAPRLAF